MKCILHNMTVFYLHWCSSWKYLCSNLPVD